MKSALKLLKYIKNDPLKYSIYQNINPILTDVSLRDGIQGMTPNDMTLCKKTEIFHDIFSNHLVDNIEVGSVVNTNLVPVMADVFTFYNYCGQFIDDFYGSYNPKLHIIVPKLKYLKLAVASNMNNFAFLSSVSHDFQKNNSNMSIEQTKEEIIEMCNYLKNSNINGHKKLYLSCVDTCPFQGKINNITIGQEIINYSKMNVFDEICLSDTCGKLSINNFKEILEICKRACINTNKLSLHLHINPNNVHIESIVRYALNNRINRFDISSLETGGCNVTLEDKNSFKNMSYELFYGYLSKYIDELAIKHMNEARYQ